VLPVARHFSGACAAELIAGRSNTTETGTGDMLHKCNTFIHWLLEL
jgi:hypothetical protein